MALDKNDIKALIAILQKGLEDDAPETDTEVVEKKRTKPKSKQKEKDPTETKNKFLSMPERNMHKDDTEIDRKLNVVPPTERTRHYRPIQVQCRVCGKKDRVNPGMVESVERYKCNRCATSAG